MKTVRTISIVLLALVPTVLIFAGQRRATARAQNSQMSEIVGVVLDANNARITEAIITIENAQFSRVLLSDDEGNFEIKLPAGTYQMTVEKDGFQTFELSPFRAKAHVRELLNVRMKVKAPESTLKIE